jgi:hypothetical protein
MAYEMYLYIVSTTFVRNVFRSDKYVAYYAEQETVQVLMQNVQYFLFDFNQNLNGSTKFSKTPNINRML